MLPHSDKRAIVSVFDKVINIKIGKHNFLRSVTEVYTT